MFFQVENAIIAFFGDEENVHLGTLAVAMPQRDEKEGKCISSTLLGERNIILSRTLAEKLSMTLGKMALVSTHLEENKAGENSLILVSLIRKMLERIKKQR